MSGSKIVCHEISMLIKARQSLNSNYFLTFTVKYIEWALVSQSILQLLEFLLFKASVCLPSKCMHPPSLECSILCCNRYSCLWHYRYKQFKNI